MNVLFVQEAVYVEFEGELYSSRISYDTYWDRFRQNFNSVTVFARSKKVSELPPGFKRSTGPGVTYVCIPAYKGPVDFFKKRKEIKKAFRLCIDNHQVFVLRIPGLLGTLASKELLKRNIRYVVEVVGDPLEVGKFLPLILPLKLLVSYRGFYDMQRIVAKASAALYVTENSLQKRYVVNKNAFISYASNVIIDDSQLLLDTTERKAKISSLPQRLKAISSERVKLGVVGMLYSIKSPLEIVRAAKILIEKGLNIELYFAGEGPMLNDIQKLATDLAISDRVICLGILTSGKQVFDFFDSLDLYIQFSKTEGLPRAMVEAMARGCAAIASDVGGIPELLPPDLLVKSGDEKMLAEKIEMILSNPARMQKAIEENLAKAAGYLHSELRSRRLNFYSQVYKMYNNK